MNEQEIENFIRVRNYSIETIEYTWASSKEKIMSLIDKTNPSDPDKIKNLLTTVDDFEEIINEMIYEKEYGVDEIPNEKTLLSHEKDLFLSKLNSLKEWYVDFLALLMSDDSEYDEVEAPGKLWKDYEQTNYDLRYSNDPNYKLAKQEDKMYRWKTVNHYPIIFSYTNIFTEMSRMRDQVIHNTGARASRSEIPMKTDHILNNKMPGNSIVLSNTLTLFIYGYVELLETLEQSMIIHDSGKSITSKSYTLFKERPRN
jgi:hypothetical protein